MGKQGYIEWRQGAAAFRKGLPFDHSKPHCWKMGYINAEQAAAAKK